MSDKVSAEIIAKTKDATAEELVENKARLLRYLSRMYLRKDDSYWQSIPEVKMVIVDGVLDMDIVRQTYEDRGIMNAKQFEQALQSLISDGDVGDKTFEPTGNALRKFETQELERQRLDKFFSEAQEL